MFTQMWGSTALGFGGIGGQAMTEAYTVVVQGPDGTCAVYWDGKWAYNVKAEGQQGANWSEDFAKQRLCGRREAVSRYGAQY
jgi:hypothetical protein